MRTICSIFLTIIFCLSYIPTHATPTPPHDTGLLYLVNRQSPLPESYRPSDLIRYKNTELRAPAHDAFIQMLAAMEAEGIQGLRLQSAYRSHEYQRAIFEQRVKELTAKGKSRQVAEQITAQSIQFPGASEHQLGLALDVSIDGKLSQSFAETTAGQWLARNCHKFGFIIRYPKERTDITGIIYEPWHLRYVGHPHAQIIAETGLTLEEYHTFLAAIYAYIVWEEDGYYLVSYSPTPPDPTDNAVFSATSHSENAGFIISHGVETYEKAHHINSR